MMKKNIRLSQAIVLKFNNLDTNLTWIVGVQNILKHLFNFG